MSAGKWIVVTGAAGGIGQKAAEYLLHNEYSVVVTSRNREKLKELYQAYDETACRIIAWNLNDLDSIKTYAKNINSVVGPISGIVHCAGVQSILPLQSLSEKRILSDFQINTFAAMMLCGCFSKKNYYVENETSFVLISSLSAHEGAMGRAVYGASKGALEGFLIPAAAELVQKGIRLNAIIPGVVNAGQGIEYLAQLTDAQKDEMERSYPLGIVADTDMANLIEFLLSIKSQKITGQKIVIDGGHIIRSL